jgi:hypothetical protein
MQKIHHLMEHGLLGILPLPMWMQQGHQEQGAPEHEVRWRYDREDLKIYYFYSYK